MIALVPAVVPEPSASRHLLPYTWSCFAELRVHCWLVPPLQSHSVTCVPLVWDTFGTSRQRPAAVLRSTEVEPPPEPATERLSNCAVSPTPVPIPTWPAGKVLSVTVPSTVPSTEAVMVLPEKPSDSLCQLPVPSADVVPVRSVVFCWLVLFRRIDQAPVSLTRR